MLDPIIISYQLTINESVTYKEYIQCGLVTLSQILAIVNQLHWLLCTEFSYLLTFSIHTETYKKNFTKKYFWSLSFVWLPEDVALSAFPTCENFYLLSVNQHLFYEI